MQLFRYVHQDQFFYNTWAVARFEQQNHAFVNFETDYDQYRAVLKNIKIDINHDYVTEYLRHLRKTKSHMRLFYSGGSDSHEILSAALKYNIFIDEIVIITRNLYNKPELQPCDQEITRILPFVNSLTRNQIGQVTFRNYDADFMRAMYSQPDWMFNMPGGEVGFRVLQQPGDDMGDPVTSDCQIVGVEKPDLLYYKGRWYATTTNGSIHGRACLNSVCLFYMMPESIQSYIVRALKFKDWVLANKTIPADFGLFPAASRYNPDVQIGKYRGNKFLNIKDTLALQEAMDHEDFDLLGKWYRSIDYLYSQFPNIKDGNTYQRLPVSKFLWFIDLETFEIFSQQELIPNGFDL